MFKVSIINSDGIAMMCWNTGLSATAVNIPGITKLIGSINHHIATRKSQAVLREIPYESLLCCTIKPMFSEPVMCTLVSPQ